MYSQSYYRTYVILGLLMTIFLALPAQSVKELEAQRKQTLQKLEITNKMLNETKKSQRSSLNKLTIINKNIKERKVLIKNIGSEIGKLETQMQQLEQEKRLLENRSKSLKSEYVKLVQEAHNKRDFVDKVMFVLSAKSFDQSYRRLRYLQEFSIYRKNQVHKIEKVTVQIAQKNDTLKQNKSTKVDVVKQKETEAKRLTKDEQKEKVLLTDLQKKEQKLRSDLKIQQKKANELNHRIESIIAEEIRRAEARRVAEENRRIAEENRHIAEANKRITAENKRKGLTKSHEKAESKQTTTVTTSESKPSNSVSLLTKEETLLSGSFERNEGRLPWPTSNGFICGHYGVQQHAVLKYVTTNNKGIYIQTPAGSNARAVFEGVVTQRFSIPGNNNAVIIQHGNYRTVYANLTQIYVREGDKVSAKQAIGKIYTDDDNDNKTELYFQIWNGKSLQNPENWIAR